MDSSLVSKIPTEIDSKDSKMYHVALVKIMDRPGEVKNDVSVNVQQYHERGFEKIQSSFRFLGYSKITVIHDPKKKNAPAQPKAEPKAEPAKTDEAKSDVVSDAKNDNEDFDAVANEVIANGTVADLDAFANDHTVSDYPTSGNKSEKQQAIKAWLKTGL
jgi:hypothetical protein